MKKDDKVIKLFDEEGNEVKFNVVAFFDIVNPETDEKNEYVIVRVAQEYGFEKAWNYCNNYSNSTEL